MKRIIPLDTYPRREQFNFFKDFEEPFFGITTEVDCTRAFKYCKEQNLNFFAFYLFQTSMALNTIENFRQRIVDDQILEYDRIHISATIARSNKTFGFSFIEQAENFNVFIQNFEAEKKRVENSETLMPETMTDQVVHYSTLPWIRFTSLSHARRFSVNDTCPKITFGKLTEENSRFLLPISIHAHHALVDGYHIGQLLEKIQENLNACTH